MPSCTKMLYQNQEAVETFLKLCETSETKEIDNLLEKYKQLHSYDKFDTVIL